jgi:hypothetical protein
MNRMITGWIGRRARRPRRRHTPRARLASALGLISRAGPLHHLGEMRLHGECPDPVGRHQHVGWPCARAEGQQRSRCDRDDDCRCRHPEHPPAQASASAGPAPRAPGPAGLGNRGGFRRPPSALSSRRVGWRGRASRLLRPEKKFSINVAFGTTLTRPAGMLLRVARPFGYLGRRGPAGRRRRIGRAARADACGQTAGTRPGRRCGHRRRGRRGAGQAWLTRPGQPRRCRGDDSGAFYYVGMRGAADSARGGRMARRFAASLASCHYRRRGGGPAASGPAADGCQAGDCTPHGHRGHQCHRCRPCPQDVRCLAVCLGAARSPGQGKSCVFRPASGRPRARLPGGGRPVRRLAAGQSDSPTTVSLGPGADGLPGGQSDGLPTASPTGSPAEVRQRSGRGTQRRQARRIQPGGHHPPEPSARPGYDRPWQAAAAWRLTRRPAPDTTVTVAGSQRRLARNWTGKAAARTRPRPGVRAVAGIRRPAAGGHPNLIEHASRDQDRVSALSRAGPAKAGG